MNKILKIFKKLAIVVIIMAIALIIEEGVDKIWVELIVLSLILYGCSSFKIEESK
jgi:hypothetical protein